MLALGVVLVVGLAPVGIPQQDCARRATESMLAISAVITSVIASVFRGALVRIVDTVADVQERTSVWSAAGAVVAQQSVLGWNWGWGWVGDWPTEIYPFSGVRSSGGAHPDSALNAFADTWLKLPEVGVLILLTTLTLTIVRAWSIAVSRRSTIHFQPALALVLMAVVNLMKSYLLSDGARCCSSDPL